MRIRPGLVLVTTAIALLGTGWAGAAGERTLLCSFESRVHLEPGETISPAQGTYHGSGTVACRGSYDGETIDAAGEISYEGIGGVSGPVAENLGGDTCAAGSGTGTVSILLERAGGAPIELLEDYELVRVGATGVATGEQLAATFQFVADSGFDCVYSPIDQAAVTGQAVFTSRS